MKTAARKQVIRAASNPAANSLVPQGNATGGVDYQQMGSDIFHELSQPLSTLVCLLEVNLMLSRPMKQLRHDLQIALKQANSVVRMNRTLRELWEAGAEHQDEETLSIALCLREVMAELPGTDSARVTMVVAVRGACGVKAQASRLRQALAHLVGFALESSSPSAEVKITADEKDETRQVAIVLSILRRSEHAVPASKAVKTPPADGKQSEWKRRLRLAIARRILEMAGGTLLVETRADSVRIELLLPSTSVE